MPLTLIDSQTGAAGPLTIRSREIETGRLVLRLVQAAVAAGRLAAGADGAAESGLMLRRASASESGFMLRRARASVAALDASPARSALGHAVGALADDAGTEEQRSVAVTRAVVCYGGVLERHSQWTEACEAYSTALEVTPADPSLTLHLARAHRLAGAHEAARRLYGQVRALSGGTTLSRFAALGEALVSADAEAELTSVLRSAAEAGDREVCAVALEERGRLRRGSGRLQDAATDYMDAAVQFDGVQDRVRVVHLLVDLLLASGDADGAREALQAALEIAQPSQRAHVVHRLRSVARAQGDVLGLRRWPAARPSALVSLMGAVRAGGEHRSSAPAVRAWRDRLAP
jgi:tetratricopeptide (TPR) repeat protein